MNFRVHHTIHNQCLLPIPPHHHHRCQKNPPLLRIPDRHRPWKRRRFKKQTRILAIQNPFSVNTTIHFESFFQLLAPAVGFASGLAALYISRTQKEDQQVLENTPCEIGEWVLFTSPTPFNRFVTLRCPSISFKEDEDLNERLVKEERHFVRLNSGKISTLNNSNTSTDQEEKSGDRRVVYQRLCVSTEDGGVISLDWPSNLELEEERGLDTTVIIVPGTPQGSMDKDIKEFVCECLRRGCFPVVMNPRGCAGSPLTTPRLFTAADSDDISTAIQFINKARPWTTLMAVGWGYGANILTKYLAEVGEKTPLTAATCINNPFDLEEATRSAPYHVAFDQKLAGGLVDILRSNKEFFQGHSKKFDIDRAFMATTVREFEKAISMVSYGFESIEDFYAYSSTQNVIGKVKIPVLFIQNDDGTVPLFSIPRSLIAENPFTSLLLCSCLPSIEKPNSTMSWCRHLTIEWLTAVELGLLKGRHPLLKDIDVTINPSKGLTLVESGATNRNSRENKLLNVPNVNDLDGYSLDPLKELLEESDSAAHIHSSPQQGLQRESSSLSQQDGTVDAELGRPDPVDGEGGQVLQTAEVVMNMLDATMPGTLTEEDKKKVLSAVGQGETLMKALQDAMPEDVRGKLTTAVSGIMHNQQSNIKFNRLLDLHQTPNLASESRLQEKDGGLSSVGSLMEEAMEQKKLVSDLPDDSSMGQTDTDKHQEGLISDSKVSENSKQSSDSDQHQVTDGHGSNVSDTGSRNNLSETEDRNVDISTERSVESSGGMENESERRANPEVPGQSDVDGGAQDINTAQDKLEQSDKKIQTEIKDENTDQQNQEQIAGSSADQNKISPTQTEDRTSSTVSSEPQIMEKESGDKQKTEDKSLQPALNNTSGPSSFSVTQALDALTNFDDSTQVAVNSVFHVIEDMITHLEGEGDNKNETEDRNDKDDVKEGSKIEDHGTGSESDSNSVIDMSTLGNTEDGRNNVSIENDKSDEVPYSSAEYESKSTQESTSPDYMLRSGTSGGKDDKSDQEELLAGKDLSAQNSVNHLNSLPKTAPVYIMSNPYKDVINKQNLRKYLISSTENAKALDLDTTTALFLDYFPEEGQWKFLEQAGIGSDSPNDVSTTEVINTQNQTHYPSNAEKTGNIIEPSYVILNTEKQENPGKDCEALNKIDDNVGTDNLDLMILVKSIIMDTLKVEVGRRLNTVDMEGMGPTLTRDVEHVANVVSQAVGHRNGHMMLIKGNKGNSEKVGTLHGEHIVTAISLAVQDAAYLRSVLPVGVIVGSSLAALRKYFNVAALSGNGKYEDGSFDQLVESINSSHTKAGKQEVGELLPTKIDHKDALEISADKREETTETKDSKNTVMVGAVTAALGASAYLVNQQDTGPSGSSSESFKEKQSTGKEPSRLEEEDKNQNNIVSSLAEKAMSVAAPVVPTKEDGELDQERLVAMLAELGQKGGILKLVGKVALLWGGIRGAMSLTDKLISFLRIAERPLFQRIIGFVGMVLVLWSPVFVPFLPSLLQSWTTHQSSKMAEFACIIGFYVSVMILITLWGKRIRAYDNPLEQYGLDLTSSPKIQNFLKGLFGGVILVLLIYSANSILGCMHLSWPTILPPSSSDAVMWLKLYGRMVMLIIQGLATATSVALVEELLFRAWLPDEIAADLGYYRAIIISSLAFSLSQRSPSAIPGLWLFSVVLSGARQRSQGSLSLPIGLRTGILASTFFLQTGGFLTAQPNFPIWVTGTHPFQPFSGIVGLAFSLVLAIIFYPRQPLRKKNTRTIRE